MKPPEGPARRALRMAALTAGVTGSYVGYLAQHAFLGADARQQKLKAAHTRAAQRMTAEFLSLRGPAMKLGQTLSLQAGVLPEEMLHELATLQMGAPGMHPTLARAQFTAAMGKAPEALFRSFAPEPFAAASLGQVHHAVTREGERVAVKLQYPGIRDAVANDFRWFRTVSKGAQLTRHLPGIVIAELEEQILAETDYARERENLEHFRKWLAPLEFVRVPRVYRNYSGDGVITMELLEGAHLDQVLAGRPSQRLRDTLGARLVELHYFQLLQVEAFHADPHWGNYLFGKEGTIGLVDFGCVKHLQPEFVATLRSVYLYPGDRTSPQFQELLEQRYALHGRKLNPAARKALARFAENFYRVVYPPEMARDAEPFDFADNKFLKTYMRESANLAKSRCALPEYLMIARAETGLYATLHRLRARVPMSRIVRKYLGKR
jgi:predicted unusual protein kinase regulating ubiquinone biosynthesis (AarF/ABC1/UbiB family)